MRPCPKARRRSPAAAAGDRASQHRIHLPHDGRVALARLDVEVCGPRGLQAKVCRQAATPATSATVSATVNAAVNGTAHGNKAGQVRCPPAGLGAATPAENATPRSPWEPRKKSSAKASLRQPSRPVQTGARGAAMRSRFAKADDSGFEGQVVFMAQQPGCCGRASLRVVSTALQRAPRAGFICCARCGCIGRR